MDSLDLWSCSDDPGLRLGSLGQTIGSATPVSYTYKPSGAVDVRTFANGTKSTYGYDARGRTIAIAHATTGGAAQATLGYGYGPDGNLQTYTDAWAGGAPWSTAYTHDKADRLTSEVRTGGSVGNYSRAYAYDANGNRTSVTWDGVTYPYAPAGADDRFDSGFGRQMLAYDGDGNPGTYNDNGYLKYFQYDEMGRVTSISGSGASSFRYDGDGRRVERVAGGVTTRFVYDGEQSVLETNGSNQTTLYRTPGVGWVRNGAQRYEFESALGSSLIVRDQSGATTGRTEYEAFGNESYQDPLGDRGEYRFAGAKGYQNDDATGMQLLGARYYLPLLGRFLTQDPIGHEGGLNLYAYCDNSPLMRTDASGLQSRQDGAGWGNTLHALFGYMAGVGPDRNVYTEQDGQGREMRDSMMGQFVTMWVSGRHLKPGGRASGDSSFGLEANIAGRNMAGHLLPLGATLRQLGNGTQAQVGGFSWDARRIGNRVLIHIGNAMHLRSLLYQLPFVPSFDRFGSGFGPFGNVKQDFYWWVDVPKAERVGGKKR